MASTAPLQPIPFILPSGPQEVELSPRVDGARVVPLIGFPGAQTTFVGRCAEIETLQTFLLDPQQRLITVLGPGGVGKTRLALAAAERSASAFPGGAALIELSALSHPQQIADLIAATLDVRGQPERSILESVMAALAKTRLLLVLDNLEHLMGPELQSLVSQLVQECTGLTILTTSRQPLCLGLEQRLDVSPMQVPDAGDHAKDVTRADSVQLFLARARAVAPDFAPGPDELLTIVEICRRVEGLPLAIELAAAWMRAVAPAALLALLDKQLPVLAGGAADQPVRLRTMRNAIAWSYDLLPPAEAELLEKLSVFRGGFPLAGAERLNDEDAAGELQLTLHRVASLCDKHLLYRADALGEIPRFGMLETVREFVNERLTAAGGLESARAAHARFYLDLVEHVEAESLGPRENRWFALCTAEAGNLREAILWGLVNDAELAMRLLSATWNLWSWRGVTEGLRLIEAALALPDRGSPFVRARALRTATAFAHLIGDFRRGAMLAAEGATYITRIDDRWLQGELTWNCGCSALFAGDFARAAADFDLALAHMDTPRSEGERAFRAYARSHLGMAAYFMGNNDLGAQCYSQSVEELRHIGSVAISIIVFGDAAGWLLLDGRVGEAQPLLEEALQIAAHAHTSWLAILPLSGLALIDAMFEQPHRAARRIGAVSAMAARADVLITPNWQATLDQATLLATNDLGKTAFLAERNAGRRNPLPVLRDALIIPADDSANEGPEPSTHITRREREVLNFIVAGRTDRDIAAELFISERTASKHVSTILRKLNAVSRAEAAVRAVRLGLA